MKSEEVQKTEILRKEITSIMKRLNWKIPQLADILYVEMNDIDNEVEQKKFFEQLKGHLKRNTTPPELLDKYLRIISFHDDFVKSDLLLPTFIPHNNLGPDVLKGMKDISKEITKQVKNVDDLS